MKSIILILFVCAQCAITSAQTPGWPEPRHDGHLTTIQPVAGALTQAPAVINQIDLGRVAPSATAVDRGNGQGTVWVAIIGGALHAYEADGKPAWTCHPPGINFTTISSAGDFDGDGRAEIALQAGRPATPYGAAVLVSASDGKVQWRCDVEPMSYAWYLDVIDATPAGPATDSTTTTTSTPASSESAAPAEPAQNAARPMKEIVVLMQGYPPDAKNGYIVKFHHASAGWQQAWRYDFSAYTCFPNMLEADLDGDGVKELAVISHSRMWVLDRDRGTVKQFLKWDTSPANVRSYGLNLFVDLNHDHRPDFLCIGNFAKHYEVLLNENGKLKEAWHVGWDDSVTTGKVAVSWPLPAFGDVDGDGRMNIVVSTFDGAGEGGWAIRVHDALSGALKFKQPGMIAARVVDADADGHCEILADRSDDPGDVRPDGGYAVQQVKGAALLKASDGKLSAIWGDAKAKAIRDADGPAQVQIAEKTFSLVGPRGGSIAASAWPAAPTPSGAPANAAPPPNVAPAPRLPADAPAGPMPQMLAADVLGEGSNQLLLQRDGKTTLWRHSGSASALAQVAEYDSTCLPVIADLDGDGKLELVLADVADGRLPRFKAITPALHDKVLWDIQLPPPPHAGLPAPRVAYIRPGKFTGGPQDDIYVWTGVPLARSLVLNGRSGKIVWEKAKIADSERYAGPSVNLASVADFNRDGKQDLVFTNPDMSCITSGVTGEFLLGPLTQMKIFNQPSQGLYTMPVILGDGPDATVCLVGGHYFRAAMSIDAKAKWFALPVAGEARYDNEGFIRLRDGTWLMGFGRQNGKFACYNVSDGALRWELDVAGSCSDVAGCDIDGDGNPEFIFGTSHGALYAIGDDAAKPRIVWKLDTGGAGQGVGAATEVQGQSAGPVLADMDGDGKPDIIIAGTDGRVRIFGKPSLPSRASAARGH